MERKEPFFFCGSHVDLSELHVFLFLQRDGACSPGKIISSHEFWAPKVGS